MQKPDYIITKRFPCQKCDGTGVSTHPVWTWYWRENKGKNLSLQQEIEWFRNIAGLAVTEYKDLPYETMDCPFCVGQGLIEQEIDLRVALREITAEVEDDFARALEDAEQWRALTRTLRVENNLEITHFKELVRYLEMKK